MQASARAGPTAWGVGAAARASGGGTPWVRRGGRRSRAASRGEARHGASRAGRPRNASKINFTIFRAMVNLKCKKILGIKITEFF